MRLVNCYKQREISFREVASCPCCKSDYSQNDLGALATDRYYFGRWCFLSSVNNAPIRIKSCGTCGLAYKSHVPLPDQLAKLFEESQAQLWGWSTKYEFLKELIQQLLPAYRFSLLDIGAHDGSLLRAMSSLAGRLSALDVYRNASCAEVVNGEYLIQQLDAPDDPISESAYDLVTMFDVVEHLYDVSAGFARLADFVRSGGYVVLETADADCLTLQSGGLHNSGYLMLMEHHVVYRQETIAWLAKRFGFRTVIIKKKVNKDFSSFSPLIRMRKELLRVIFQLYPAFYRKYRELSGQPTIQPPSMYSKDHMLVVLKKLGDER